MAKNGKGTQGKGSPARGAGGTSATNGKTSDEAPAPTRDDAAASVKPAEDTSARAQDEGSESDAPKQASEPVLPAGAPPAPTKGAAWAAPIVAFEAKWTWFESRLITFVLLWQLAAMLAWVLLNGLSESVSHTAGAVFRGAVLCIGLGTGAWFGARKLPLERRRTITLFVLALALAIAPFWKAMAIAGAKPGASGLAVALAGLDKASSNYFDNFKGWLQGASTLTLMGGLRGLATRLTLWLALLGGSLATGAGKHIHIDVIYRFLPTRLRIPAAIVNYVAAAVVCIAGAWGFVDHIAITSFGANKDDSAGSKVALTLHTVNEQLFFTRKQMGLDLGTFPAVARGQRYDGTMSGADWNSWVDGAGLEGRFTAEQIKNIKVPEGTPSHLPLVLSPSGETMQGSLAHTLALVFPFGLLAIALRFLLRALMTASGHLSADPNEAHKEDLGGGPHEHAIAPVAGEKGSV